MQDIRIILELSNETRVRALVAKVMMYTLYEQHMEGNALIMFRTELMFHTAVSPNERAYIFYMLGRIGAQSDLIISFYDKVLKEFEVPGNPQSIFTMLNYDKIYNIVLKHLP